MIKKPALNFFTLLTLLALLIGSFIQVTPAQAAGIVVNTATDEDNANTACSLREAITASELDSAYGGCSGGAGADTITFAANYTITLNSQLPVVNNTLIINGNGAANTIIQANAAPNTATYRVFEVGGDLTLNNLTVQHGRCNGSCSTFTSEGGGIINYGTLTVIDSIISNNSAGTDGGGIFSNVTLTVTNSIISNNSSDNGGGIMNQGEADVTNSIISNNSANQGGGVFNFSGALTVTNSTFSSNSASTRGGGLMNYSLINPSVGPLTVTNSTFSDNAAPDGGGILNDSQQPLTLKNSTLSNNSASNQGGGIHNLSGTLSLTNTIIANSTMGGDCFNDITNGVIGSNSNNLIESTGTNACGLSNGSNSNIIGSDPNLGSLTGSPAYFPLNAGSPAIDTGTNTGCPATDQRGTTRPQGSLCDIGSYELGATVRAILPSNGAQDGWVRESSETSEVGGTVDASASVLIVGDDASDRQYRSVLSFDTSSLPDAAVISQATLAIRVNAIQGGGNPLKMFNYFMIDVANGSFGTSALAAQDFQASPTVSAGPLGQTNTGGGWLYIDLKTAKTGINPTGLTQVRLRYSLGDNDNGIENILKFYSGNYATVKHRPQLNVWYSLP